MTEVQISKMMKALGISREEAIEVIREDEEVDKMKDGEVTNDLTKEQKKNIKKMTSTTSTEKKKGPTVYKLETRGKKKDEKKEGMIKDFFNYFNEKFEKCEITNPNKEISFEFEGESYSIQLVKHRKAK